MKHANLDERNARLIRMRDRLIEGASKIERSRLNGDAVKRLPGNFNICALKALKESLLLKLIFAGICASSALLVDPVHLDPSHVLLAIGLPHEIAHGSLRISFSDKNTERRCGLYLEVLSRYCILPKRYLSVMGRNYQ